jgi:hypothetical protein
MGVVHVSFRALFVALVVIITLVVCVRGGSMITIPKGEAEYVIGIGAKRRDDVAVPEGGRSVIMTGANGAAFKCILPNPRMYELPDEESLADAAVGEAVLPEDVLQKTLRSGRMFLESVPGQVRDNLRGGCFTRTIDYWTYEVCPFRKITQYHVENTRRATEFSLGTYIEQPVGEQLATGVFTQKFDAGTAGRQSRVRFVCYEAAKHDPNYNAKHSFTAAEEEETARAKLRGDLELNHMLVGIAETQVLHYEITVATDLACDTAKLAAQTAVKAGAAKGAKDASAVDFKQQEGGAQLETQLMSALSGDCLYMIEGWWTYKVCFGDEILQYHSEREVDKEGTTDAQGNKAVKVTETIVQSYRLGKYASMAENPVSLMDLGSWDENYIRTTYEDGELCDLSGKPRKTELRVFCDPQDAGSVTDVTEVGTCSYVVDIKTPIMCNHPRLKPDRPKLFEIKCHPLEDLEAATNVSS